MSEEPWVLKLLALATKITESSIDFAALVPSEFICCREASDAHKEWWNREESPACAHQIDMTDQT